MALRIWTRICAVKERHRNKNERMKMKMKKNSQNQLNEYRMSACAYCVIVSAKLATISKAECSSPSQDHIKAKKQTNTRTKYRLYKENQAKKKILRDLTWNVIRDDNKHNVNARTRARALYIELDRIHIISSHPHLSPTCMRSISW